MPLFLYVLFEKLNPKERAALIAAAELTKEEAAAPEKLATAAKKLERDLKSRKAAKGVAALCAPVQDAGRTGALPGS